jgi:glycerol-3-phosphate dehydrogenase
MSSPLEALTDQELDALILGGGLTGAAIARELAARGARVALAEPIDFGWGASGRSSRLGLGWAPAPALGAPFLLRTLLAERLILARSARHLVRPTPVIAVRTGRGRASPRVDAVGTRLAAAFARRRGWPGPRVASRQQIELVLPGFALLGPEPVQIEFDALIDDRRLTLLTALDARRCGAHLALRCDVIGLEAASSGVVWAEIRDRLSGEATTLKARAVINATGAWSDQTRGVFDVGRRRPSLTLRRSARVVAARAIEAVALLDDDRTRRRVLVTPAFRGLLAASRFARRTADDESLAPDHDQLEETLRLMFGDVLCEARARFSATEIASAGPRLVRDKAGGVPFWSVVCGEALLHRPTARNVADRLAGALGPFPGGQAPASGFLPGGDIVSVAGEEAAARAEGLSSTQARWVVGRYGSLWRELLQQPGGDGPLGPGEIPLRCEVGWALAREEVRTLSDLLGRWRLPEIVDASEEEAISIAAESELAAQAGWPAARRERERLRWKRERAQVYGGEQER